MKIHVKLFLASVIFVAIICLSLGIYKWHYLKNVDLVVTGSSTLSSLQSKSYSYNIKDNAVKQITVSGYDEIENVIEYYDNGFYCVLEKKTILKIQNSKVLHEKKLESPVNSIGFYNGKLAFLMNSKIYLLDSSFNDYQKIIDDVKEISPMFIKNSIIAFLKTGGKINADEISNQMWIYNGKEEQYVCDVNYICGWLADHEILYYVDGKGFYKIDIATNESTKMQKLDKLVRSVSCVNVDGTYLIGSSPYGHDSFMNDLYLVDVDKMIKRKLPREVSKNIDSDISLN